MLSPADIRFSVAPMMDCTDRHCRYFHRLLSRRARLYTEMVTAGAVIFGPRDRLLGFNKEEHPVAVQLGGSEPEKLAEAAAICADFGYDEINLNVGCPSERVKNGAFGACLMREPELVGTCVAAMKAAVRIPVTVKCRIGIDDQEPEAALFALTQSVVAAGADALFVHARKAWLQGLSPRENCDIPPLDYPLVYRLKAAWPALSIAVNGGIATLDDAKAHLDHVDGVMLGRAAYRMPELLLGVDDELFGETPALDRDGFGSNRSKARNVIDSKNIERDAGGKPVPTFPHPALPDAFAAVVAYLPYVEAALKEGVRLADMTGPLLGLFSGIPGARAYRRTLSAEAVKHGAGCDAIHAALACLERPALAA